MKPATILGIGAVTPLGRDLPDIAARLASPPISSCALRAVMDSLLNEPKISRSLRRADRFVRMAAIAALDACKTISLDRAGLIVVSGLGPHCRGFKFIDGMLDCGDAAALPTDFSHSVHGAGASYIAGILDLRGPCLTATDFQIGFEQAVLLAQCWLEQGSCNQVVVGVVEELGDVLIHCAHRMRKNDSPPLGEGAVFLALGPYNAKGIATLDASKDSSEADVLITDESEIPPEFRAERTISFTEYFGPSASSTAFQLLGGLLANGFDNAATLRRIWNCNDFASLLISSSPATSGEE